VNRAALEALYVDLAPALATLAEPWCVIGSAAMMVADAPVTDCPDLDIMTTGQGAEALEAAWARWRDAAYAPDRASQFRSRFSAYDFRAGRVEVMGDLLLRRDDAWKPVALPEAVEARLGGLPVRIPAVEGQIALLEQFGRPKDLAKGAVLRALQTAVSSRKP
jgi:hypothetical protein